MLAVESGAERGPSDLSGVRRRRTAGNAIESDWHPMFTEAAIVVLLLALWLINWLSEGRRPKAPEHWRMQRARELARRSTRVVEGRLLVMDRDVIRTWKEGGDPDYGPTYLVYEFTPREGPRRRIEARHYITEARAAEPDLVMRIGRSVRVRYAVDDPEVSMVTDIGRAS